MFREFFLRFVLEIDLEIDAAIYIYMILGEFCDIIWEVPIGNMIFGKFVQTTCLGMPEGLWDGVLGNPGSSYSKSKYEFG